MSDLGIDITQLALSDGDHVPPAENSGVNLLGRITNRPSHHPRQLYSLQIRTGEISLASYQDIPVLGEDGEELVCDFDSCAERGPLVCVECACCCVQLCRDLVVCVAPAFGDNAAIDGRNRPNHRAEIRSFDLDPSSRFET
jgi:hypothetical protein